MERRHGQKHGHNRWLIAIGVLKLLEAVVFILLGFGTARLLHKDLVDVVTGWAIHLHLDPDGDFVNHVTDKVALLTVYRLRLIIAFTFCHAALDVLEGVGLVLQKIWAEYVTIILTASFLPLEIYELIRRVTWIRAGIMAINLVVLAYLIYHLRARLRAERAAA